MRIYLNDEANMSVSVYLLCAGSLIDPKQAAAMAAANARAAMTKVSSTFAKKRPSQEEEGLEIDGVAKKKSLTYPAAKTIWGEYCVRIGYRQSYK
jgi:hypothetical protein